MTNRAQGPAEAVPAESQPHLITIMLEEYRQLYRLVQFRLSVLDARLPITALTLFGGALIVALAPVSVQWIVLIGAPNWLVWIARTTANHARSLEDALRRIEEIERSVDELVPGTPLKFQSSHPSRGVRIGGRTGEMSVHGVIALSIVVLAACAFLVVTTPQPSHWIAPGYTLFASAALWLVVNSRTVLDSRHRPLPEKLDASQTRQ